MPIRGMEDKREQDEQKLRELAYMDELTNLYNRRYLYQSLPTELKNARQAGRELCLFMMDVDKFKEINDTYGHLCGDKVLRQIAEVLRRNSREGDTVVRYAGDEFLAILPGAEESAAVNVAERIIKEVDQTSFREDEGAGQIHLTISIGLAFFPGDAKDPERLIYQADRALYTSKRSGRNRISVTKDVTEEVLGETKLRELFPCPQLIGRSNQIKGLNDLLEETEKGGSNFVLVGGEKGIGKSRLIEELKKQAQAKGITSISATCSPEISNQPYQIVIKAMDNLFSSLGPEVREFVRSLPQAQAVQLANYVPILKQFLPEGVKPAKTSSAKQEQIDLFKGISQSLVYIVKRNTLLLLIDDFHWIDKGALQLFNYIVKTLGGIPILIVGAYRPEEFDKRGGDPSLKELLQQMKQAELVNEINLEALKKAEVQQMITAVFAGLQVSPKFVDIVYDVSAGNPLFIEEVLRSLVDKGFVFYQDKRWQSREISEAGIPPFLKGAIQKRVALLDEETRPVISAAAVIGEAFDFNILCQLLNKDPGYVWEIIDRAAKEHLIMPESHFETDKLKFNSGIIRDVIYTELDSRQKQDLHRRLALIEEKLHKDNIDSAAGSLGYHFSKAQDKEKAALYGNMLLEKARHMPTYDDVFSYIQQALIEKVEKIVVSLSAASMKLVPAAVQSLHLAAQNMRLYPLQSAVRKGFIDQAYKHLNDILEKDSTLIIAVTEKENRLLANGEEIGDKAFRDARAAYFVSLMNNHRIKTIGFKRGLSRDEVSVVLEGLSRGFDDLVTERGFSGFLHKGGVVHVSVNEVRYAQTGQLSKQKSKLEEAMFVDYLIGKVSNLEGSNSDFAVEVTSDPEKLAEALTKVAERAKAEAGKDKTQRQANIIAQSLQKLSKLSRVRGVSGQYHKNISKAMMRLDYKLRSRVMAEQIEADEAAIEEVASKGTIKNVVSELSDEQIIERIIKELSQSRDNLVNLRNLINKLLPDPERRQKVLPELKAKISEKEISEEELSYILGQPLWQGLSVKDKAQRLIKITPQIYLRLQKELSGQIDKLVLELLESDCYNEASEVLDKLLKQSQNTSKEVRAATIGEIDRISQGLIARKKYFLLEKVVSALVEGLDKEKEPEIYSAIVQLLADNCAKLIKKESLIQATGILKEFNLRLNKTSKLSNARRQTIKEAKAKTFAMPSLLKWLAELLEAKVERHEDFYELSGLIGEIGAPAIEPLFALAASQDRYADPFRTYSMRWSIGRVLKGVGDEAAFYFKDKLADKNGESIKIALELLGHIRNTKAVAYLGPLLKSKQLNLRKEVIATLGKIGGKEAIELLSGSLKDRNSQTRLAVIRALANTTDPQVLPLLKPLLKERQFSDEVKRIIQRIEEKS